MAPTPTGWQAVYQLVVDAEARTMKRINEVDENVSGIKAAMDTHLLGHAISDAASIERVKIAAELAAKRATSLGRVRTFIATVLPIPAAIVAGAAAYKVFIP